MVVHSTTKFLNGHSDGLGGVVVCTTQQQADKLAMVYGHPNTDAKRHPYPGLFISLPEITAGGKKGLIKPQRNDGRTRVRTAPFPP